MRTKEEVEAMLAKVEGTKGCVDGRGELIMALEWVLGGSISTSLGLEDAIGEPEDEEDESQTGLIHLDCGSDHAGLHCDTCGGVFVLDEKIVENPEEGTIKHDADQGNPCPGTTYDTCTCVGRHDGSCAFAKR